MAEAPVNVEQSPAQTMEEDNYNDNDGTTQKESSSGEPIANFVENLDWAEEYQPSQQDFDNLLTQFDELKNFTRDKFSKLEDLETVVDDLKKNWKKRENPTIKNSSKSNIVNISIDFNTLNCSVYGDKSKYGNVVGRNQNNIKYYKDQHDIDVGVPSRTSSSNEITIRGCKDLTAAINGIKWVVNNLYSAHFYAKK